MSFFIKFAYRARRGGQTGCGGRFKMAVLGFYSLHLTKKNVLYTSALKCILRQKSSYKTFGGKI